MSTTQLYNTVHGTKIPQLGIGTFLAEKNVVRDAVIEALRVGYRHIDCAECYANQEEVGTAFNQVFNVDKSVKREDVWITSKYFPTANAEKALSNVKQTLKDLNLDYLDLYLIHWPSGREINRNETDVATMYKETWQVFEKIVDLGLVKNIGVSNLSCKKLETVQSYAQKNIFTNQVEIHPYWRNQKLRDYCKEKNIHLTAYSVLGNPSLNSELPNVMKHELILKLAEKYGKDVGQILIRWGIQNGYAVLAKSVSAHRVKSNFDVFDFELSSEDMQQIAGLEKQFRLIDGDFLCGDNKSFTTVEELWDGEI